MKTKPFTVTLDSGKEIKVAHPEMVVLTSDKQTAVIVERNTVNIADLVNISSINFLRKAGVIK